MSTLKSYEYRIEADTHMNSHLAVDIIVRFKCPTVYSRGRLISYTKSKALVVCNVKSSIGLVVASLSVADRPVER